MYACTAVGFVISRGPHRPYIRASFGKCHWHWRKTAGRRNIISARHQGRPVRSKRENRRDQFCSTDRFIYCIGRTRTLRTRGPISPATDGRFHNKPLWLVVGRSYGSPPPVVPKTSTRAFVPAPLNKRAPPPTNSDRPFNGTRTTWV